MALTNKKYEKFYKTTGSGDDKLTSDELSLAEDLWDLDRANGMKDHINNPDFAPLIFQLQQIQDELDYLRTEISTNKDKATFPGFGTSGSTALVGNTPLLQLGTTSSTALRGDTEIPPITIKLGTGITLTLVVELDDRGSGIVGAIVEDTRNRKTYTGSISLTEKR